MPTIAVRPSLGDYDNSDKSTTGSRRSLALRVKAALRRHALLSDLAAGALAGLSPELALRASKLASARHRHRLANTLRRTIRDAHQATMARANIVIIDRRAVIGAEPEIEALIERLESDRPVAAQGMAMVELMITDAVESPLYDYAKPGTLRQQVLATTIALELEPEA
ncbi:MAG TPA: hypothetical protein VN880_03555, partial [Solirubrobacteraceae bacterium]|nr:hypothetical protein [Solirubrobacteraceae bacterium]